LHRSCSSALLGHRSVDLSARRPEKPKEQAREDPPPKTRDV
jgi:hypothetical protein